MMKSVTRNSESLKRLFTTSLCMLLIVFCGFGFELRAFAETLDPRSTAYVEDLELYVTESGDDAVPKAKSYFEDKGWVFSGLELNPGTGTGMDVYLGYKTTSNRDMAVTDIKIMGMGTGYQLYNYRQITEYLTSLNTGTAQTLYDASREFIDCCHSGSPKALDARDGLNLFCVEKGGAKLGDHILSGKADRRFFTELLLKAGTGTVNAVINFLNAGISPYENGYDPETAEYVTEDWASRVSQSELWEEFDYGLSSDEMNELHSMYNDSARELFKQLQDFTVYYENAKARYDSNPDSLFDSDAESLTTEEIMESMDEGDESDANALYLNAYELFNMYTAYSNVKLGDYLIGLGRQTSDAADLTRLYPIVEAMGDSQAGLANIGGFLLSVSNLGQNTVNETMRALLPEARDTIADYNGSDSIVMWENGDDDIGDANIAFTSNAVRSQNIKTNIGAVDDETIFFEKVDKVFKIIGIVSGAVYVVAFIMTKVLAWAVAKLIAAKMIQTALYFVCSKLLSIAMTISFFNRCLGTLVMVFTIAFILTRWLIDFLKEKDRSQSHSEMPEYIFDTIDTNTGVQNIKYRSVRGSDGAVADLNAWKQYRWNIMAYTRDSRVGSPVCADAQGNIFMSVTGSHSQISGWSYARGFGERTPANTNAFCEKDKVSGCYLHYRTEASIKEEGAAPGILPGGDEDNQDARPSGGYIDDIVIETAANEIEAKAKVLNHEGKFYLLDYDLSPDTGVFTFLGYSLTDDPEDAVTDIRVAPSRCALYRTVRGQRALRRYNLRPYTDRRLRGRRRRFADQSPVRRRILHKGQKRRIADRRRRSPRAH